MIENRANKALEKRINLITVDNLKWWEPTIENRSFFGYPGSTTDVTN